ncbi:N-acetylmuramoyl-L-alanine amidase family protein [Paenibacillus sp. KN14-4R]|uniref:N-acetylmuramoyl-L-alanine amidase family protein n=1 Tax=Paenibacillus sp. KN14-4R TaxID=3445773 RepID=UPI003FA01A13
MKRKSRKQLQRRQAILLEIVVALVGMIWSKYELISSWASAELTVSPKKNKAMQQGISIRHKIVIDAGHGGKDPGADGASGKRERAYTLALSKKIFDLLKQEPMFEAYMTRTDDTFVDLEDRVKLTNDLNAEAFVSIHGNTYRDSDVSGTETYYYADDSFPFASKVHEYLVKATGFKDRGVRKEHLKVLTQCNNLTILLEVGFLTNQSDRHQDRTAIAIVKGIKEYFAYRKN